MKTFEDLQRELDELKAQVEALKKAKRNGNGNCDNRTNRRGPQGKGTMTGLIAWRIRFGDRKAYTPKENMAFFGISTGQIYSINKYTFQWVTEDSFTMADVTGDAPQDDVEVEQPAAEEPKAKPTYDHPADVYAAWARGDLSKKQARQWIHPDKWIAAGFEAEAHELFVKIN